MAKKSAESAERKTSSTSQKRSNGGGDRKQALLDIAAEMFAERGYKATTVRQIGNAAGVLSGSLYHHFDSKEAFADTLLSAYLDQLTATYRTIVADEEMSALEKYEELVRTAFRSLESHRAAVVVLQNEGDELAQLPRFKYLPKREREIRDLWVAVLKDGIDAGLIRPELYRFTRDAIWVAGRWYRSGGKLTVAQLTDQYLDLFVHSIGTRP